MAVGIDKYTTFDLWYEGDGDLAVDPTGDLKDTSSNDLRALIQEIQHVLCSSTGDWKADPGWAADLAQFIGQAAIEGIGLRVAYRIKEKLVELDIVTPGELDVIPLVVGDLAFLRIVLDTPVGETTVHYGYDSDNKRFIGY